MSAKPKRIQLKRTKGWRMPIGAVKVDRNTRWGNPFNFKASEFCWAALSYGCKGDAAGRQEASVRAFKQWIEPGYGRRTILHQEQPKMVGGGSEIALGPEITAGEAPSIEDVQRSLRGKDLACWCRPGSPCHADVLLEIANR